MKTLVAYFFSSLRLLFLTILILSGCELNSKDGYFDCQTDYNCIDEHPYCYAKDEGEKKCWTHPQLQVVGPGAAPSNDTATDEKPPHPYGTDISTDTFTASSSESISDNSGDADSDTQTHWTPDTGTTSDTFAGTNPVDTQTATDSDSDTITDTNTDTDTDSVADITPSNDSNPVTDSETVTESETVTDSDSDTDSETGADSDTITDSDSVTDSETGADSDTVTDSDSVTDSDTVTVFDTAGLQGPDEIPARPGPRLLYDMNQLHEEGITAFATTPQLEYSTLAFIGTLSGNLYRISDMAASPFAVEQIDEWPLNETFVSLPDLPVTSIAIDPCNAQYVYVTFAGDDSSITKVWRSSDGGESFTPLVSARTYGVTGISVSPTASGVLYLVTGTSVWSSNNFGDDWSEDAAIDELYDILVDNNKISEDDRISAVSTYLSPDGTRRALVGTREGKVIWAYDLSKKDALHYSRQYVNETIDETVVYPPSGSTVKHVSTHSTDSQFNFYVNYEHDIVSQEPHMWGFISADTSWFAPHYEDSPLWYNPTGISINPFFSKLYLYVYDTYSDCAWQGNQDLAEWTQYCLN